MRAQATKRTEDPATEEELADEIRRAQTGEIAAFEKLYRRHVGRTYALCLRLSGDRSRAEELTQETFVRAWEKLKSFRSDSAFSTWLHTISVNAHLTLARTDGRREDRVVTTDDLERCGRVSTPRGGSDGDRMDLERAIRGLPPGAREVFVLHDIEGYRHDEIGGLTGVAVGTSKGQLHRARKLLQEALR